MVSQQRLISTAQKYFYGSLSQQQQQQTPHLLQSSSSQSSSESAQEVIYEEPYETPELTLTTHVNDLEVLCEVLIDFENLKENGFDLCVV